MTGRDRCGKPGEEAEGGAAGLPCSIPSQRSAAPCPAVRVAQTRLPAKPQLGLPSAGAGAAWPLPRSEERPFLTGSSQSVELSWGPEEAWRPGGLLSPLHACGPSRATEGHPQGPTVPATSPAEPHRVWWPRRGVGWGACKSEKSKVPGLHPERGPHKMLP